MKKLLGFGFPRSFYVSSISTTLQQRLHELVLSNYAIRSKPRSERNAQIVVDSDKQISDADGALSWCGGLNAACAHGLKKLWKDSLELAPAIIREV